MLLHCLRPMHSPVFPSGVVHLQRTKSVQFCLSDLMSSYVFFSSGWEPPPNDICERQKCGRRDREIIITKCRILSFDLRTIIQNYS